MLLNNIEPLCYADWCNPHPGIIQTDVRISPIPPMILFVIGGYIRRSIGSIEKGIGKTSFFPHELEGISNLKH